ncbi:hypothetical protein DRP05_11125 [Archaeoglobales archaeon]|nr:MAG: hypothetical protein DRP05_11125 [Archaeoglobales archaeon]
MGWIELMKVVEEKVIGTVKGYFRPLDGIPFFTVCYPPEYEREAIRQFKSLSDRLNAKDIPSEVISMKDVLKDALIKLGVAKDGEELAKFEMERDREELIEDLRRYLPDKISEVLLEKLSDKNPDFVAILTRTGILYPLVRTSSIRAKLENRIKCILIIAYPANEVGEMLYSSSFTLGGYYRGEVINWR